MSALLNDGTGADSDAVTGNENDQEGQLYYCDQEDEENEEEESLQQQQRQHRRDMREGQSILNELAQKSPPAPAASTTLSASPSTTSNSSNSNANGNGADFQNAFTVTTNMPEPVIESFLCGAHFVC